MNSETVPSLVDYVVGGTCCIVLSLDIVSLEMSEGGFVATMFDVGHDRSQQGVCLERSTD